jgi:hypothetical protein
VLNRGQNERKTAGKAKWNQKGAGESKRRGGVSMTTPKLTASPCSRIQQPWRTIDAVLDVPCCVYDRPTARVSCDRFQEHRNFKNSETSFQRVV